MSNSISTLLLRNLFDVFGKATLCRRAALEELWNEDGVFYDPNKGVYRGHDEIDRIAGAVRATHPAFQYQPISEPEELGNSGRVEWVSGIPGQAPAYAGTDFLAVEAFRGSGVSTVKSPTCSRFTAPRRWGARSIIQTSGMISPTSCP
jgi:hypothetical protein